MIYLIDTQILIWSLVNPPKLSDDTQKKLKENTIWASQVSLYEIAIKQKIGKLPEFDITTRALVQQMERDGFHLLPLSNEHIAAYQDIPLQNNHRDPFDRLILATSLAENIPVISADTNFKLYTSYIQLVEN